MNTASLSEIGIVERWLLASRPKTLLASLVPVFVGGSIAIFNNVFHGPAFAIALICSALIQVGTNFTNDLFDHLTGKDTEKRVGPTRAVSSGLIKVSEMRFAVYFTFGLSFVLGLYLVYLGGWIILLIGIVSIFAGVAYTAGPFPLAYNGLGDIFVFLFFGFVGTVGTYYVQALEFSWLAFWASIPVGALITNILVVNNYRDRIEDRQNGKNTLAVKFGAKFTRIQYVTFMVLSYSVLFLVYVTFKQSLLIFLPLISLPLAVKLIVMIYNLEGTELNKALELTAKLSAIYGILFAIGILI
ncbi:MAG: 1,4-dihydroxy-2-naphthoate polyprenyltransferase [Melioribacteraceae bacterium]|nr:1,4-dihydroxy-2-naphthoate polyprenyltransferase [Melioribacteraceae bacterium]